MNLIKGLESFDKEQQSAFFRVSAVQWQYSCDPRHRLIQQSYELNFQFRDISDTLAVLTGKKFQVLILLLH